MRQDKVRSNSGLGRRFGVFFLEGRVMLYRALCVFVLGQVSALFGILNEGFDTVGK